MFHDTIGANLRYAKRDATDDEIWAVLEQARIADLLRLLPDGLDTVVGDRGYRLSGGERPRLAIDRLLPKAARSDDSRVGYERVSKCTPWGVSMHHKKNTQDK